MPYIDVRITEKLSAEKIEEIKCAMGKAITAIPGKTEEYLMVCVEDAQNIWFAGNNSSPSVYVNVKILGKAKAEDYFRMTGVLCEAFKRLLEISPDRVYVTYSEVENWGWNGKNF